MFLFILQIGGRKKNEDDEVSKMRGRNRMEVKKKILFALCGYCKQGKTQRIHKKERKNTKEALPQKNQMQMPKMRKNTHGGNEVDRQRNATHILL